MALKDRIVGELTKAMKTKDAAATACLRLILAAIKNREIEKRGELDDTECIKVLSTLVKQRNESIDMYRKGGRQDLVEKETAELGLIRSFLPEPLSEEELMRLIDQALAETEAAGMKDMGKVMGVLAPKVSGRADGKRVSELVRGKLQGS